MAENHPPIEQCRVSSYRTDLDLYASKYSAAGAMRAAFGLYRAFEQDISDNRAALESNGRLEIPVLSVGGIASTTGPVMETMVREVAHNVTGVLMPDAAHWVAEENPERLMVELRDFLGS